mmetsp:Transcript_32254/g.108638  ORF Transcript_32254/g.108638 Transcript_32254/m.108638 type:complete len:210 (-) Transcript_32254:128-757(-)
MKLVLAALCLAAPAAAFVAAPAPRAVASVGAKSPALPFLEQPKTLDGTLAGDVGFDPLGLSEIDDLGIDLYWMREAEIKHGRIAMLAAAGVLWVEAVGPLPGFPAAEGRSQMDVFWDAWDAHPNAVVSSLVFISIIEAVTGVAVTKGRESGERVPGDFLFNPLGFKVTEEIALKEIKNGRLAMWAVAGMILQGVTTHATLGKNLVSMLE